jgi:hypothetical protein
MAATYGSTTTIYNGSTSALAAKSAQAIKLSNPSATDGVYWINLPTVGPTQVFCLMDNRWDGGGWMMAMKAAATGTTFQYSANFWTTANTLNPTDNTRNAGDAKYNTMNYFAAKDMLALWPDLSMTPAGGSLPSSGVWAWLQNDFYAGQNIVPITFFNTVDRWFIGDAKLFPGWGSGTGTMFSSQLDIRFYGFNYRNFPNTIFNITNRTRWGFGWNENGEGLYKGPYSQDDWPIAAGSNDLYAGIGMEVILGVAPTQTTFNYSAGERRSCCTEYLGFDRQARVEVYIR